MGEVVAGEGQRWKSIIANLFLTGRFQDCRGLQAWAVEDVVKDVLLLPGVSDLPGGPLEAVQVVGRAQGQGVAGGHGGVDWLRGLSIEVNILFFPASFNFFRETFQFNFASYQ